ncbi:hypothetical protein TWF281_004213 [Arthrobotrys megalospora]
MISCFNMAFFTNIKATVDNAVQSLVKGKKDANTINLTDPRLNEQIASLKAVRRNESRDLEGSDRITYVHDGYLVVTTSGQQYLLENMANRSTTPDGIKISIVNTDLSKHQSNGKQNGQLDGEVYIDGIAWRSRETTTPLEPGVTVRNIHDRMIRDDDDLYGGTTTNRFTSKHKSESPPGYSKHDPLSQNNSNGTQSSSNTPTTRDINPQSEAGPAKQNLGIDPTFELGWGSGGPSLRLGFTIAGFKVSI